MNETQRGELHGKIALVTGATGGIGKEIARGLARMGAHVIVGTRAFDRGDAVRRELALDTDNANVEAMLVDVASQESVRAFVAAFSERHDRLDILVNNAGVWLTDRRETTDGHELTLATNVLGPYMLTSMLAEHLRAAGAARVVNVVSGLASKYDAQDLEFRRRKFSGFDAYAQSKAALRMLTWGFARRFANTQVTVNAAAPGFVKTDFNRNARGFTATMITLMSKLFAVGPEKGADTPLWVATSFELDAVTGRYYDQRKAKDGGFHDPDAIAELERFCADATGVAAPSPLAANGPGKRAAG
jgi:NAD(P)-dependent dehydrogenase (short-subunit alcohol dehydrogenase family)